MQATTCLHDGVANAILQEVNLVFQHPVAFHPTNGVYNTDSDGRNTMVDCFLRRCEFTLMEYFIGLDHRQTGHKASLESRILIQTTARWQRIAHQIRNTLIMRPAFIRDTQKANVADLLDHKEVFECVAFLFPTVILLLLLRVFWALDWVFGPTMKKRGTREESSGDGVVSIIVN